MALLRHIGKGGTDKYTEYFGLLWHGSSIRILYTNNLTFK
jgi:hypothetical protein